MDERGRVGELAQLIGGRAVAAWPGVGGHREWEGGRGSGEVQADGGMVVRVPMDLG